MTREELDNLNYLHDATVLGMRYTMAQDGTRDISIETICHEDSGFEAWNGKRVEVLLNKVILLEQFVYGHETEGEQISGWEFVISEGLEAEAQRLEKLGVNCSGLRFDLSFQSGSYLKGICRQINILVHDA